MKVVKSTTTVRELLDEVRRSGRSIAFVPTLGALHRGHASLIDAARSAGDAVVVSIFVNPAQFGPKEDFSRYPRDEAGDLALCKRLDVELAFLPSSGDLYPPAHATSVRVQGLTDHLCGPHRPGHFAGVALIVAKLFNIVQPQRAYFGEKDAQQLAIIRRMTADLDFPVKIIACPTIRESDGLALSSRNRYLSEKERCRATALYTGLCAAQDLARAGERSALRLVDAVRTLVTAAQPTRIDYISLVDTESLQPISRLETTALMALAVWFGDTRLIDNVTLTAAHDPRAEFT